MFKYVGLIAVLLSWIAGTYLLRKWRGTRAMSISMHAASSDAASRLFMAVLVGVGLAFYIWLITWFTHAIRLPWPFLVLVSLAFLGQVVAGIVPDIAGFERRVHRIAAYGMAALFLPISFMILRTAHLPRLAYALGIICFNYLCAACFMYFFVKRARSHYLVFQVLYILAFQSIILLAAYFYV